MSITNNLRLDHTLRVYTLSQSVQIDITNTSNRLKTMQIDNRLAEYRQPTIRPSNVPVFERARTVTRPTLPIDIAVHPLHPSIGITVAAIAIAHSIG